MFIRIAIVFNAKNFDNQVCFMGYVQKKGKLSFRENILVKLFKRGNDLWT